MWYPGSYIIMCHVRRHIYRFALQPWFGHVADNLNIYCNRKSVHTKTAGFDLTHALVRSWLIIECGGGRAGEKGDRLELVVLVAMRNRKLHFKWSAENCLQWFEDATVSSRMQYAERMEYSEHSRSSFQHGGGKKKLQHNTNICMQTTVRQVEIWILLMYFSAHLFFISQSIIPPSEGREKSKRKEK